MSVPLRLYFFSQCTKINWEVLKHFSHKHQAEWTEEPKQSRAKRTDVASKAFRKVKRETPHNHSAATTAWDEKTMNPGDVGTPVEVHVGVPTYWKNQDLDKDFDEMINLSAVEREKMQKLLDVTFKAKATRDRSSEMPSRLLVN